MTKMTRRATRAPERLVPRFGLALLRYNETWAPLWNPEGLERGDPAKIARTDVLGKDLKSVVGVKRFALFRRFP